MGGAAIGQIVAIDRGHHHVLQTEPCDGLGDPSRFARIERANFAMRDGAIRTIARAYVAHQHEGGRAMAEAFPDIRTACLLAYGVKLEFREQRARAEIFRRGGRSHLDPIGMFSFDHGLTVSFAGPRRRGNEAP